MELNPEYIPLAERRLAQDVLQFAHTSSVQSIDHRQEPNNGTQGVQER